MKSAYLTHARSELTLNTFIMARSNLRSASKQVASPRSDPALQSSSIETVLGESPRTTRTRKPTQRAREAEQQERTTRRSRRITAAAAEQDSAVAARDVPSNQDRVPDQPPRKRRRIRRQVQEPEPDEAEPEPEPEAEDEVQEENALSQVEEEDDSRPSEAFLRSVNESITGSALPRNRWHQRPSQLQQSREEEQEGPQPVATREATQVVTEEPEAEMETHQSYNARARSQRQRQRARDQRTLAAEPSTGHVSLAPETRNITLPTRQQQTRPGEETRSTSSDLFVSDRAEEESQSSGEEDVGHGKRHPEPAPVTTRPDDDDDEQSGEEEDAIDYHALEPREDIDAYLEHHGRPGAEKKRPTVKIRADKLANMESILASKDWSGLRKDFRETFARRRTASGRTWAREVKRPFSEKWPRGKILLKALGILHDILDDAPAMPEEDEQNQYFSTNLDDLKPTVAAIEGSTDKLGELLLSRRTGNGRKPPAAADEVATETLMPLLAIALCKSFRLGASFGEDEEIEATSAGTFTTVTLGIISHLTEIIARLSKDLMDSRIRADVDHKPLQRLSDHIQNFQRSVDDGLRIIKDRDPERLRRLKERDELIKRARQREAQEAKEDRDRRMSAFITGTQRIGQELSQSTVGTQQPRSSRQQPMRFFPPPSHPPLRLTTALSQEPSRVQLPTTNLPQSSQIPRQATTPQPSSRSTAIHQNEGHEAEGGNGDGDDEDDAAREIAEQFERDREERLEAARLNRIQLIKEKDRLAQQQLEAKREARREIMRKRLEVFAAATHQMTT